MMDGKLMQSVIPHIIGVSEAVSVSWENATQPYVKYVPNVIKFIGYISILGSVCFKMKRWYFAMKHTAWYFLSFLLIYY